MAAIGTFDGVHLGHRSLIAALNVRAAFEGLTPMIVTFDRHPLELIAPQSAPPLLMSPVERFDELRSHLSTMAIIRFDDATRRLTAHEFMAMLRDRYGVEAICMGFNHHFGSDRLRSFDDYRAVADSLGMKIYKDYEAEVGGQKVSSTIVRNLLQQGDVAGAMRLLGRPYRLAGIVGEGRQLGRQLGFPTANLKPLEIRQLIPAPGVYACDATLSDCRTYRAMVNIGVRPTVDASGHPTIEAHLLGFTGDLYGLPLTLHFIARIRDEQRFPSLEALAAQLRRDAAATQSITHN